MASEWTFVTRLVDQNCQMLDRICMGHKSFVIKRNFNIEIEYDT